MAPSAAAGNRKGTAACAGCPRLNPHPQAGKVVGTDANQIPVGPVLNAGGLPPAAHHHVKGFPTVQAAVVVRQIKANVVTVAVPIYLQEDMRIKAHFLICFLALVIYRYLEKGLGNTYTCETILDKLKTMNFADVQEQGFMPLYTRDKLTDALHQVCGFETDFQLITKSQMKTIQKKSKGRK